MNTDKFFIRMAAIAAMITFLTTIGVHFVSFSATTFEERLLLGEDFLYIAHKWMIIFHCLCVIISMAGIAMIKFRESKGWIGLGLLFYIVFAITEITRMFYVLQYLNGLRSRYLESTDELTRAFLSQSMDQFSLIAVTLFAVFVFAFGLGNLCYGIVLSASKDFSRWIGYGFLFWACTSFLGLANNSFETPWIESFMDAIGKYYQPLFRLLVGVWLFRWSSKMT